MTIESEYKAVDELVDSLQGKMDCQFTDDERNGLIAALNGLHTRVSEEYTGEDKYTILSKIGERIHSLEQDKDNNVEIRYRCHQLGVRIK